MPGVVDNLRERLFDDTGELGIDDLLAEEPLEEMSAENPVMDEYIDDGAAYEDEAPAVPGMDEAYEAGVPVDSFMEGEIEPELEEDAEPTSEQVNMAMEALAARVQERAETSLALQNDIAEYNGGQPNVE